MRKEIEPKEDTRSSDEITLFLTRLEGELRDANKLYGEVSQHYNAIRRRVLDKRQEITIIRKDLATIEIERLSFTDTMRKARENMKRLESEIKTNEKQWWRAKNEKR